MKTTRLAFNLFTDSTAWTDDPERLSPVELFSCDYAPYYWQAIRIRFPQYTAESEGDYFTVRKAAKRNTESAKSLQGKQ